MEVVWKLHPQPNSVFIRYIESGLSIVPGPIFLIERVEGQEAKFPVSVFCGEGEGRERGRKGDRVCGKVAQQISVILIKGYEDGERNKVLDETNQPRDVLYVTTASCDIRRCHVTRENKIQGNYRECTHNIT